MTLTRISTILANHGIAFREAKNSIIAEDVYTINGEVSVEEVVFNEATTIEDLKIWLGY